MLVITERHSGWPMLACARFYADVWTGSTITPVALSPWLEGLPVPTSLQASMWKGHERAPVVPLWPGFAINTLFYGTLTYGTMAGWAALKRRRRVRRGLCAQCAYPLTGGDLCPECGMAVRSATKSSETAAEPAASTPV